VCAAFRLCRGPAENGSSALYGSAFKGNVMRKRIRFLVFVIVVTVNLLRQSLAAEDLPNILLITIDTLRADHLSSYGYHLRTSPVIDHLASEGVRFDRAYSVIPLTGPSHLSLFTSRYPQEHGARINGVAVPRNLRWLFLPQVLQQFGYANLAFVSAWPLTSRLTHLDRWFDTYDEELTRSHQLFYSSRYAEDVNPRVIAWLTQRKNKPFFLWVHYFDPHSPYVLREEFASPKPSGRGRPRLEWRDPSIRERIRQYDSEIGYTDHHVGQLLEAVDRCGLSDSTLVVLTSDHGESLGEHGYVGHGRRLSEGIVRVPLVMRYPERIPAGLVIRQRVSLLDVMPTVLDLTVATIPHVTLPRSFGGLSLASAIDGREQIPKRTLRYLTFAGKKGAMPTWLSWMWVRRTELPLRLGKLEDSRKWVWTPGENLLSVVSIEKDPLELNPEVLSDDNGRYEEATSELRHWFKVTDLTQAEMIKSKLDEEVLESLGYTQ
jgi:arylsulfatase A-like enzyme